MKIVFVHMMYVKKCKNEMGSPKSLEEAPEISLDPPQ